MSNIKLKEVLSREIRNRGVSTSQLARLCGIPKSTLHDWVSGRLPNSKNIHLIKDLSEFLGISISLLLFNQEEKKQILKLFQCVLLMMVITFIELLSKKKVV